MRLARETDAEALLAVYAPYVHETSVTFELIPPTVEEFRERVCTTLKRAPWLLAEENGCVIGYAYGGTFRARPAYQWSAEVSVYLTPAAQGRGLGRALYLALFDLLRAQNYCTALAGITLPNAPSVRLHEKLGFTYIGAYHSVGFKHGNWHDVGWWELPLRERPAHPAPLRLLAELTPAEWESAFKKGELLPMP